MRAFGHKPSLSPNSQIYESRLLELDPGVSLVSLQAAHIRSQIRILGMTSFKASSQLANLNRKSWQESNMTPVLSLEQLGHRQL
jgi:hypothetical protein